ncbi:SMP-30/gluconolactonase/LRE family protein [Hoyosella sp. G463]|uniref:SMP-30/gluconolactonase/LRE family protein n=1 Tax=Lolliginicoccus lacisalsi TaxID=2742202 RepID=A0A927J9A0_9ACTN|nr:SMP-30/gluconolactonase/LRE family protein [Lolliginicoccus lacisalsi]
MSTAYLAVHPIPGEGPEDIVLDEHGTLYTGLVDGRIISRTREGEVATIATVPGRPLGIELLGADELVVCASDAGLLAVSLRDGAVRVLVDEVAGVPLRTCNNAAVAADGTIFFSDSSALHVIPRWRAEMIERTGTGRLLRRDPDGSVEVVREGLQFANGVALGLDESYVIVAETTTRRIERIWLTGDAAGEAEPFAEDLPGYPDNCSTGSDGLIWVALANPRNAVLDVVGHLPRAARRAVGRLPEKLLPTPSAEIGFLAYDDRGVVAHEEYGRIDGFSMLTSVREHAGELWFGSLTSSAIAHARL